MLRNKTTFKKRAQCWRGGNAAKSCRQKSTKIKTIQPSHGVNGLARNRKNNHKFFTKLLLDSLNDRVGPLDQIFSTPKKILTNRLYIFLGLAKLGWGGL